MNEAPVTLNQNVISEVKSGFRILVVDDNESCATVMMWLLEDMGHTVVMALDGKSAIELAKSFIPDVAFLDIGLPVMNGYEICQAMQKELTLKDTVFIAQTGWGEKKHRERSMEAGFSYHLVKPIDINMLKKVLSELNIVKH